RRGLLADHRRQDEGLLSTRSGCLTGRGRILVGALIANGIWLKTRRAMMGQRSVEDREMRNIIGGLGALGAVVALGFGAGTVAGIAQQATPTDLVDALNGLFGKHAGDRAAHTKGICLTGKFTPSAEAPKLSKAAHFAKEVPIRARFSLGGGDPKAPDNAQ